MKSTNQVPLFFGLDTGASKTNFDQPLLSKVDDLKVEKRTLHAGGIGEVREVEVDSIESLIISLNEDQSIELQNLRMVLVELATFFKLDGVFGSDIVKNGRMMIDYPNRRIEFIQ